MTTDFEKLMDHLESISIWKPADVTQEPNTTLTQWRIYRVKGDFHGTGDTIHFLADVDINLLSQHIVNRNFSEIPVRICQK